MVCRIGRMASVGRRACLYRFARPLPLGAGDYVRPAGFGLVCGEGVGVFSRFFYLLARRRVISSSSVVGLLASPFFLCRHRPVPPSSSPLGLLASPFPVSSLSHRPSRLVLSRPSALLSVFSCGFLSPSPSPPVPSTSRAGRSLFARLIRCGSRPAVPVFACPRGSSSPVPIPCGRRPVLVVASARVSSPFSSRSCLPVLRQAWAGSVAARSLLACLVRSRLRFPFVRACGVVGRCVGVGVGCVRFVVSLFVYINRVPARVS